MTKTTIGTYKLIKTTIDTYKLAKTSIGTYKLSLTRCLSRIKGLKWYEKVTNISSQTGRNTDSA